MEPLHHICYGEMSFDESPPLATHISGSGTSGLEAVQVVVFAWSLLQPVGRIAG